jgi:hypothetical protein
MLLDASVLAGGFLVVFLAFEAWHAPEGWQDGRGFHLGKPEGTAVLAEDDRSEADGEPALA